MQPSSPYYLTEVDKNADSIYCMQDRLGEYDIPAHVHSKGQFLYTEGGIVHVILPGKTFFLPARHYMWIPPLTQHSIHPGSADVIMRNLYFPVSENEEPFYFIPGVYPVSELLLQMLIFTDRWSGDLSNKDQSARLFATAMKAILPEISVYNLPLALPYAKDKRLAEVIFFMRGNLGQALVFPEIARYFGFSKRSLSRLFRHDVGLSFIQYLTIQRMMLALELLLQEGSSVKEVASMVGYESVPTFSTTFYKMIGIRPTDYVKTKYNIHK